MTGTKAFCIKLVDTYSYAYQSCRSAGDQQQPIANHDKVQSHRGSGDACAVKRRRWLIEYCHSS